MPTIYKWTKALLKETIQKEAKRLGRVPTRWEIDLIPGIRQGLRKLYGDRYTDCLKELGMETYDDRREKSSVNVEEKQANQNRLEIVKLKNELALAKKHVAALETDAVSSRILKELIHGVKDSQVGKPIDWLKPNAISDTKGIPILFLSDLHFDEVVLSEQIQGLNRFNRDIATKRLQHTFNTTIQLLTHEIKNPKYDGIVCALGGDLLSGNIHEELAETNEASILQSVITLTDILIQGIEKLKNKFGRVFVPCVVGNHGRIHKKPRAKNRVFDNYEWIIYQYIAKHFSKDESVTLSIPDGPDCMFQVYEKTFLLTHGDQFKGGNGISGIFSPLMLGMSKKLKKNSAVKRPFDVMICGHFHQLIMTPSLIINGSLKGYDEYANLMNFGFEPPQQALMIVHPQNGITHQMPVLCSGYEAKETNMNGGKIKSYW